MGYLRLSGKLPQLHRSEIRDKGIDHNYSEWINQLRSNQVLAGNIPLLLLYFQAAGTGPPGRCISVGNFYRLLVPLVIFPVIFRIRRFVSMLFQG